MAPEERDRIFDKALRRHLRSVAPAGEATGISNVSASQSGACPDPETLAAYHERSLLPEQLNSLKEHIIGCPNCQTVLAHLETTDEILLEAAKEEQALAQSATTPITAASSQAPAPSPEALPRKSRRARLLRGTRWQWLAPAGAIAAGLLMWIAFHENSTPPLPSRSESEIKMAQNKVPPSPAASRSIAVPPSSAPEKPAATLPPRQSSAGEPVIANGGTISGAAKPSPAPSEATGARLADSLTDKEGRARKDRERDASTDELTAANNGNLDAKNLPEELRKENAPVEAAKIQTEIAQLQNSQTQIQSNNYVSPKVPGPSPMNQMESTKKSKSTAAAASVPAGAPPQPEKAAGVVSSHNDSPSLKLAGAFSSALLISPPGSNTFWRVGRRGLIEFSKDGGSSWTRQTSGVVADLLTGSAPSDQVCWIIGRLGAILLTTDGGAHWKIVPSPLAEDLGGVHAADALHTVIWNARATKSFETSDGGLTWKPVSNP